MILSVGVLLESSFTSFLFISFYFPIVFIVFDYCRSRLLRGRPVFADENV